MQANNQNQDNNKLLLYSLRYLLKADYDLFKEIDFKSWDIKDIKDILSLLIDYNKAYFENNKNKNYFKSRINCSSEEMDNLKNEINEKNKQLNEFYKNLISEYAESFEILTYNLIRNNLNIFEHNKKLFDNKADFEFIFNNNLIANNEPENININRINKENKQTLINFAKELNDFYKIQKFLNLFNIKEIENDQKIFNYCFIISKKEYFKQYLTYLNTSIKYYLATINTNFNNNHLFEFLNILKEKIKALNNILNYNELIKEKQQELIKYLLNKAQNKEDLQYFKDYDKAKNKLNGVNNIKAFLLNHIIKQLGNIEEHPNLINFHFNFNLALLISNLKNILIEFNKTGNYKQFKKDLKKIIKIQIKDNEQQKPKRITQQILNNREALKNQIIRAIIKILIKTLELIKNDLIENNIIFFKNLYNLNLKEFKAFWNEYTAILFILALPEYDNFINPLFEIYNDVVEVPNINDLKRCLNYLFNKKYSFCSSYLFYCLKRIAGDPVENIGFLNLFFLNDYKPFKELIEDY